MEKGKSSSKTLLNCEICFTPYDLGAHVPMILKECGHTYCSLCIANKRIDNNGIFACPKDNSVTKLPVAKLFKNADVIRCLERSKLLSSDVCEDHSERLNFFCKTENKLLCEKCIYSGSHLKHEIISEKLFLESLEKLLADPQVVSPNDSERNENKIILYIRESKEIIKKKIEFEFENLFEALKKQKEKVRSEAEACFNRLEDNLRSNFSEITKTQVPGSEIMIDYERWKREKSNNIAKNIYILANNIQLAQNDPQWKIFESEVKNQIGSFKIVSEPEAIKSSLKMKIERSSPRASSNSTPEKNRGEKEPLLAKNVELKLDDIVFSGNISKPKCLLLTDCVSNETLNIFRNHISKNNLTVQTKSIYDKNLSDPEYICAVAVIGYTEANISDLITKFQTLSETYGKRFIINYLADPENTEFIYKGSIEEKIHSIQIINAKWKLCREGQYVCKDFILNEEKNKKVAKIVNNFVSKLELNKISEIEVLDNDF